MSKEKSQDTRSLKYIFDEEEKKDLATDMANQVLEKDEAMAELKTIKGQIDARIKTAEGRISGLAEKLRSGYEYRQVRCEVIKDYEIGIVIVTRLDTNEVIEDRKMKGSERQMILSKS